MPDTGLNEPISPDLSRVYGAVMELQSSVGEEFSEVKRSQEELHTQLAVMIERVQNHTGNGMIHQVPPCSHISNHLKRHEEGDNKTRWLMIGTLVSSCLAVLAFILLTLAKAGLIKP